MLNTIKLEHVPKSANKMANAVASLVATLVLRQKKAWMSLCTSGGLLPPYEDFEEDVNVISDWKIDEEYWCQPLIGHLQHGKLPNDSSRHRNSTNSSPFPLLQWDYLSTFLSRPLVRRDKTNNGRSPFRSMWPHQAGRNVWLYQRIGSYWPTIL